MWQQVGVMSREQGVLLQMGCRLLQVVRLRRSVSMPWLSCRQHVRAAICVLQLTTPLLPHTLLLPSHMVRASM